MLVSINEAARLTGLSRIEIGRLIQSRRLRLDKGADGKSGIEKSRLKGLGIYNPPEPKQATEPPPRPTVEPRAKPQAQPYPEAALWYPSAAEMKAMIVMESRDRALAISKLVRQHPHLKAYFRENPLPPVFKKAEEMSRPTPQPVPPPRQEPEPPVLQEPPFQARPAVHGRPVPPAMPAPRPVSPEPLPARRSKSQLQRFLGILMVGLLGYHVYAGVPLVVQPIRPWQPIKPTVHHIYRQTLRRRKAHNWGWPPAPPVGPASYPLVPPAYIYQGQ